MEFKRTVTIHMSDTDMTGVVYFAQFFRMGLEAFEELLIHEGLSLRKWIMEEKFLLPIVHAEGDFSGPVRIGDAVDIFPRVLEVKTSSFRVQSEFFSSGEKKGKVEIVHVTVDPKIGKSMSIPSVLREILGKFLQSPAI